MDASTDCKSAAAAAVVVQSPAPAHLKSPRSKSPYPPTPQEDALSSTEAVDEVDEERGDGQADLELQRTKSSGIAYSVFSTRHKNFIVFMASVAAFFSPFTANIYFPALNALAESLHVSVESINLTLTTYLIFQGLSPTVVGDLAETFGRRPAYLGAFVVYIGACIGCALTPNYVGLLILRMLQSAGSSGTMALASAVVADISVSAERGTYMGWAMSGAMIGPAFGPIIGGLLSEYLGWRAIFWFLTIIGAVVFMMLLICLPETGRKIVGNGSRPPQRWNYSLSTLIARKRRGSAEHDETPIAKPKFKMPNPLLTLKVLRETDAALVLIFNTLNFAAYYQLTASLPFLLTDIYHFNVLQIGLSFIPFGVGCLIAPSLIGYAMDRNFKRVARAAGFEVSKSKAQNLKGFPLEKARVPIAWPLAIAAIVAEIIYGWCLQFEVSLAVPLVMTFIMGLTFTGLYSVSMVMLVDYYPQSPATAAASVNLCRCLLGAGATAVIIYMIKAMGRGWAFTFVALVLLAQTPILWVLSTYGPGWREARRKRLEAAAEAARSHNEK